MDLRIICWCVLRRRAKHSPPCTAPAVQTCILRAWPIGRKPWLVAPAMNTAMWEHPLTGKHLGVVQQELQGRVVPPKGSSTLACGDTGAGAMATVQDIVQAVQLVEEEHGSASAAQAAATAE